MPFLTIPHDAHRGSWRWTMYVAELAALGSSGVILLVALVADLSPAARRGAVVVAGALVLWTLGLFRVALPRAALHGWTAWANAAAALGFATALYALFRGEVPSAQLVFVPAIVVTGLLAGLRVGFAAGLAGSALLWAAAAATGGPPSLIAGALNASIFLVSGSVAGALSGELRSHYEGEQEEHRLATAAGQRLRAVLDAVDESIVFRDRHAMVRVVNRRARELFEIEPAEFIGRPAVELLRTVARQTEDPEGFMEAFQELREDPAKELRQSVEQIIPQRRQLQLYSRPMVDEVGTLVGRIDLYSDVTEAVRRADEVERLYEEARAVADSYRRALLPDRVPSLPRLNLVAHHIGARGRRAVRGDFYDFVPLHEGREAVVLGDVCGIGPLAANDAALARYSLRSLAGEVTDPAELMRRMNAIVYEQSDFERFARLLLAVIEPERAALTYVSAGHVPPVLYRSTSGTVEWLSEGGPALGIEDDVEYKQTQVVLEPGDMLLLYTDGVTEGTRNDRVFGQRKLGDLVERYGVGTPGELVQAVRRAVEAWAPAGGLRDDVAMVVCQVVADAAIGELTRELVLPNEAVRIAEVRAFVSSFCADLRAPVVASQELVLAVSEAAANATRYARNDQGSSEIRIRCAREAGDVVVVVADDGPGLDPLRARSRDLPDRFASGGRGLFLMHQFTDSVDVESTRHGTSVRLRRRLFD